MGDQHKAEVHIYIDPGITNDRTRPQRKKTERINKKKRIMRKNINRPIKTVMNPFYINIIV